MKSLNNLKINELKAICDSYHILYPNRVKKTELITLIKNITKREEEVKIPLYHYKLGYLGSFVQKEYETMKKEIGGHFSTMPFEIDYLANLSYI